MRVIKFRAWDEADGLHRDKSSMSYNVSHNCDATAIMQFTGLTDKNGKEIYEDDIITCQIYEREMFDDFNSDKPIRVVWSDEASGFYPFNKGSQWRSGCENIEVIGNIYENPELLKI